MLHYVAKVATLHDKSLWTPFLVIWMIYSVEAGNAWVRSAFDHVYHNFATMQIVPKAPLFPMEASEKGASGSQISPGGKGSQVYVFV